MREGSTCRCGCSDPHGADVHHVVAALATDDLDAAIDAGLLDCKGCASCTRACTELVMAARDDRRAALAARVRFRAREARRARLLLERLARRATNATDTAPPLPPAAADALQRALARAAAGARK